MSIYLMNEVDLVDLPRPQIAVLTALANFANDEGEHVFPSIERIAWRTRYDRSQVQRIMAELRRCGVLEVVEERDARGLPTVYRINLDAAPKREKYRAVKCGPGGREMSGGGPQNAAPDTSVESSEEEESSHAHTRTREDSVVELVMREWREITGKRGSTTPARTKKIRAALNGGYSTPELRLAVVGAMANPYFAKDNPHYLFPETLFRDEGAIERHIGHALKHATPEPWWPRQPLPRSSPVAGDRSAGPRPSELEYLTSSNPY